MHYWVIVTRDIQSSADSHVAITPTHAPPNRCSGASRAVTIRASYYSSNTFDADGNFVPQDECDLGTNKCATVTIGAGATGFSAKCTPLNAVSLDR